MTVGAAGRSQSQSQTEADAVGRSRSDARAAARRLSKVLAVALRHRPEAFGITVDEHGWAPLDPLLAAVRARGGALAAVDRRAVEALVATSDKPRYELAGGRIRARYGHSVAVVTDSAPVQPPAVLFHGTNAEAHASIRVEGLQPMARRYVHLSEDVPTARTVGARRRHAATVVLVVDAAAAAAAGVPFHRAASGVWLAGAIPAEHLAVVQA